jgi:hypothetical protein
MRQSSFQEHVFGTLTLQVLVSSHLHKCHSFSTMWEVDKCLLLEKGKVRTEIYILIQENNNLAKKEVLLYET